MTSSLTPACGGAQTGPVELLPRPARLRPGDVLRQGTLGPRIRRLRAMLSALGIALGIAALVAVTGVSASSKAHLLAQLDKLGSNLLTVSPGKDLNGMGTTLPPEAEKMLSRIGPVQQVTAITMTDAKVYRTPYMPKDRDGGLQVVGARRNLLSALRGEVQAGRWLDASSEKLPTVVLGHDAAQALGLSTPGTRVWIAEHWYAVIGILRANELAPEIDRSVLMSWTNAVKDLKSNGTASTVYLRADPDKVSAVQSVAGATANPAAPQNAAVSRPSDLLKARYETVSGLNSLVIALASVALLVGGVGIANTMVVGVMERRGEIGLRRSLGARTGQIATQFLIEAAVLGAVGGIIGAMLGALGVFGYATWESWPEVIPMTILVIGPAVAMAVGVMAGLYPALRASRLAPTEALRSL
ncbi:ABC transporter permease [Streptomyces silvisoli]|uniref:ABC transporter permease n=1 Tax=Streptomyces silvisoli TaxID=3034235 RepID=A0ABT5ZTS3_9ACTN|nr:ABC transporter permease [Streptomyces silvisoli]MDF3293224.1 ABC transporter permease [Streptomyces silvisoli]